MTHVVDLGISVQRIRHGILAGLAGGVLFGGMMHMMGMMEMIAGMVGSTSVAVGWLVHLVISAAFGVGLAVLARPPTVRAGLAQGLAWGVILWVVAGLVAMRLIMGMPIELDATAMASLMGHAIYGLAAGGVLATLVRRSAPDTGPRGLAV